MPIVQDQIEALSKQVFITDYLLNGLFPCQSDVVRLIRSKKRKWDFNDKFEYRMLLSNTNTGGTLNSQLYRSNVGLIREGELEYGTYRASYGTVTDGFDIDMMLNLETSEKRAAFETDYATRLHSLRNNVAALFKNFAIHGRFGVVHQIRSCIGAPEVPTEMNPKPNTMTNDGANSTVVKPVSGIPFTIKVPINVFSSNFKKGRLLIKTKEPAPWGAADATEMYMVVSNEPNMLTLVAVGTTVSAWQDGEFLELAQNREVTANSNFFDNWVKGGWSAAGNTAPSTGAGSAWYGIHFDKFTGTGTYTSGNSAITGAMEGLADLFPWYTNPAAPTTRLGIDRPFRGQTNRMTYPNEQAGGFIVQKTGEHIIDAIMRGLWLTKATVPHAEICMFMNPVTRLALGYEEGASVQVIRDNLIAAPLVYQRGVTTTDYQIGNQQIKEVVEDANMPTDVILIGPKNDMSYNAWDNATADIDSYIQETWGKSMPPKIQDVRIPDELIAKMDLSKRLTFGAPTLSDGVSFGGEFRHPKNVTPVAMHEMGALYTEYPYTYTVVKLREPICDLSTT